MRVTSQRLPAALLAGLLLAACSGQPTLPPEAPPLEQLQPTPAPAPPPPLPAPDEFRVEPRLSLQTAKESTLYTGRGTFYLPVAKFGLGAELAYVSSREGWFEVRTPAGEVGWLRAADVTVSDGRDQPVRYLHSTGKWELEAESGFKIAATRIATGVMQMTLTGLANVPERQELQDGSLLLKGALPEGLLSAIEIGDSGLERISLSERGILVELSGRPVTQVVQSDPSQVVLEFRPGLERIERTATGWALQTRGALRPVLRQEGSELVLDLPAAGLAKEFPGLPDGIGLAEVGPEPSPGGAPQANSLTATIPTRMANGGLRLRLPLRSDNYALYRTGPGRLELRWLQPGLAGKRILIDPGHGGEEIGAVGGSGHLEKNVNLVVALLLQPMLEAEGAQVIMTRTEDSRVLAPEQAEALKSHSERSQADLALRSVLANQEGVDLYLSIHANGGPPGDGGIETFWAISNLNADRSQHLAELVQQELLAALGLINRGVKQRPFNVIRNSEAPAVLVELGFMTNAFEERLLISEGGQRSAAEALFRGIQAYFGAQ